VSGGPSLAVLDALPDDAMVPVRWVRQLVDGLERTGGDDGLGLTVADVAERTGRAVSTCRTWCADGRLPGARRLRGREWRVPAAALRALLEDGDAPGSEVGGVERLEVPRGGLAAWREAS
jgi:excisionase family DNA binding protein